MAPLGEARAREVTAGLRAAMDDVRRSAAVLAARVREAHAARVWVPLGHASWASYCDAEFGISRAQAYRLLDVARALTAIRGAVRTGSGGVSHARDSGPQAGAAFDYGLSQRALAAVSSRADAVAELITRCLAALTRTASPAPGEDAVRAVVRQVVAEVRAAPPPPPPPPAGASAGPAFTAARAVVEDLVAVSGRIGELMLRAAPAHLSDTEAADALALLCEQIGTPLDRALAARRYALSGDRRALYGTVL